MLSTLLPVKRWVACLCAKSLQLCPTLSNPMDCSLPVSSIHRYSPGKNTGVGCHALLQGICPTQGLNLCLLWHLHCRWILYGWATGEASVTRLMICKWRTWSPISLAIGHRMDWSKCQGLDQHLQLWLKANTVLTHGLQTLIFKVLYTNVSVPYKCIRYLWPLRMWLPLIIRLVFLTAPPWVCLQTYLGCIKTIVTATRTIKSRT